MPGASQIEEAALRAELLQSASPETRRLLELIIEEAPRMLCLEVSAKNRGERMKIVLRLYRPGARGDAFHVAARSSGVTWWVRMPEIRRGRISRVEFERVFGDATAGRDSDDVITVRLDSVDDVWRMLWLIERFG